MKKLGRNIISWFLLIVLFISTSGFSVFSHMCILSGDRQVAMKEMESCCAQKDSQSKEDYDTQISSSCCVHDTQFLKLKFDALRESNQAVVFLPLQSETFNLLQDLTDQHILYLTDANLNLPPPKSGRTILLQQDLLRI